MNGMAESWLGASRGSLAQAILQRIDLESRRGRRADLFKMWQKASQGQRQPLDQLRAWTARRYVMGKRGLFKPCLVEQFHEMTSDVGSHANGHEGVDANCKNLLVQWNHRHRHLRGDIVGWFDKSEAAAASHERDRLAKKRSLIGLMKQDEAADDQIEAAKVRPTLQATRRENPTG